ncbi:MipA/OmpV family protein [Aliiglaciecola sp. LCG003]|uniref:MipA/OmpV family protein n=1 Tax=Aliiglaciecola sp. LCG003 TaxID=3053655 RepID=UPI0025736CCF|nr:MipA/OmpV family protein [Aliiglaciecola sp. LCG003]WJG10863.1 MipA/OmpV family protein [Aliiglaciecola sp. LCG003]
MKTLNYVSLGLVMACVSLSHQAQATDGQWTVGAGVIAVDNPYIGVDSRIMALPFVTYKSENLTFRGFAFDYKVMQYQDLTFSIILKPGDGFLDSSDSDNEAIRALSDRDLSYYAGVKMSHSSKLGSISAAASHDLLGNGDGYIIDADYSYPIHLGENVMVVPTIGVSYNSADVSNYYYGVAAGESDVFDQYALSTTVNAYIGLVVTYKIDKNWSVSAMAKYTQLDKDIEYSPIIDDRQKTMGLLSLNYRF